MWSSSPLLLFYSPALLVSFATFVWFAIFHANDPFELGSLRVLQYTWPSSSFIFFFLFLSPEIVLFQFVSLLSFAFLLFPSFLFPLLNYLARPWSTSYSDSLHPANRFFSSSNPKKTMLLIYLGFHFVHHVLLPLSLSWFSSFFLTYCNFYFLRFSRLASTHPVFSFSFWVYLYIHI